MNTCAEVCEDPLIRPVSSHLLQSGLALWWVGWNTEMMTPISLSGEDTGKEPAAEFHVSTMPSSRQVLSMSLPPAPHTFSQPLGLLGVLQVSLIPQGAELHARLPKSF